MKAMTILAAAATLFAGASSVALADRDDVRHKIQDLDRKIAHERVEIDAARRHHDWDKMRHDQRELDRYLERRSELRDEMRRDRRYDRRDRWDRSDRWP